MDDRTEKTFGGEANYETRGWRIPWLALGVGLGAAIGAAGGELAWGIGSGAAIGLCLQQWYGRSAR